MVLTMSPNSWTPVFLDASSSPTSVAVEQHQKLGSVIVCLPLVIFLCVAWALNFANKGLFPTGSVRYMALVSASFGASSISMITLNKVCVEMTRAPSMLTALQMSFAVVATLALHWKEVVGADRRKMLRWCIVPVFYAGMLNSSLISFKYMSLSLMIVFRNLAPLITMPVENLMVDAKDAPKVSFPVVVALITMVIGAALSTIGQSDASWIGLGVVVLNTLIAVLDRLLQRRLLVLECRDLPLSACMTLNNSLGMLPTLAMAMVMQEVQAIPAHQAAWTDPATLALIGLSGAMGMAIGFFGLMCQKAMTATSFQVLQNLNKILVVFVGVGVFGDTMDSRTRQAGMLLSIVGSAAYGLSRASEAAVKDAGPGEHQALLKPKTPGSPRAAMHKSV